MIRVQHRETKEYVKVFNNSSIFFTPHIEDASLFSNTTKIWKLIMTGHYSYEKLNNKNTY